MPRDLTSDVLKLGHIGIPVMELLRAHVAFLADKLGHLESVDELNHYLKQGTQSTNLEWTHLPGEAR